MPVSPRAPRSAKRNLHCWPSIAFTHISGRRSSSSAIAQLPSNPNLTHPGGGAMPPDQDTLHGPVNFVPNEVCVVVSTALDAQPATVYDMVRMHLNRTIATVLRSDPSSRPPGSPAY